MNTESFKNVLLSTYEIILDIIKMNGDNGIVNRKRQETYYRAIHELSNLSTEQELGNFVKELNSVLTEKPKKIMKELLSSDQITLDQKAPYNGIIIKNGKILTEEGEIDELEAFKNLSILAGIGIGIGVSGIKDLIKMGYSSIEELKIEYEKDKLASFRKGLQTPLCKYFEGTVRIEKMSREEATKWRDKLSSIIDDVITAYSSFEIKHKIAGSYARKKQEIGDIDYIIVVNSNSANSDPNSDPNSILYKIMNKVLDKLTEITCIGGEEEVEFESVTETPSKAIKGKRYSTSIKMWFKIGLQKRKIEIYGYTNAKFIYPFFARSAEVNLQKKLKMQAIRHGYKLSPWSLDLKDTDICIETIPEQVELIESKLGKNKIETLKDLFCFLNYSRS